MTETELRLLLARYDFHFSKSMGQNFLVDPEIPERIADGAKLTRATHVLEIGPGIGALTAKLCSRSGFVTAVELDKRLPPLLQETLANYSNVEIVSGDALKLDFAELLSRKPDYTDMCVCANLPYNITSPILAKLLESRLFRTVTVMIQREVAHRLCAEPGTPDYGAFTVFTKYYSSPEILFDVPPQCFIPQPGVTSSVIRLDTFSEKPPEVTDEAMFFRVVKASFAMRRKTLLNGLRAAFGDKLSRDELAEILAQAGLAENIRGETLGIPEFARLADILGQLVK
jgi:16S rRNA (adenine1518-N6/adenine1519-N6)-dimethyltransferase